MFVFLSAVRSKIVLFSHDSALTLNLFFLKQKAVYAFFVTYLMTLEFRKKKPYIFQYSFHVKLV